MPIENEIKFVLHDPNQRLFNSLAEGGFRRQSIRQLYIGRRPRIRKIKEFKSDKTRHIFTFKQKISSGVSIEVETDISEQDFNGLSGSATAGLFKERFKFQQDGVRWDVDFFLDGNKTYFVLAEAEMEPGRGDPGYMPSVLLPYLLYSVPRSEQKYYQSRKLSDRYYAERLLGFLIHNGEDMNA